MRQLADIGEKSFAIIDFRSGLGGRQTHLSYNIERVSLIENVG